MNFETLAAAAQAVINANNIAMEGAFLELKSRGAGAGGALC